MGEMLQEMPKNKGESGQFKPKVFTGSNNTLPPEAPPKLEDIGISKMQSSRYQSIATLPEEVFEEHYKKEKD